MKISASAALLFAGGTTKALKTKARAPTSKNHGTPRDWSQHALVKLGEDDLMITENVDEENWDFMYDISDGETPVNPDVEPSCDIPGYDCNCERLPPVDPFSRKPVPTNEDYEFFFRDVEAWTDYKMSLGWTSEGGWTPIPDGYFGYWVFLNRWEIFGYEDWEEWRYGVTFRNIDTNEYVDWDIVGGVNFIDQDGEYIYEYVIKVPDTPEANVGDCFTTVHYDATHTGSTVDGSFVPDVTPSIETGYFCVGEPYRPMDQEEMEWALISSIYTFADENADGCVTHQEMVDLFEWCANADEQVYADFVDEFYTSGDVNADGLTTWSEFNQWLQTQTDTMRADQAAAFQAFFKYFEARSANEPDFALSREEAIAGIQELSGQVGYFYDEFNYFWQFFNINDDDCISQTELQTTVASSYDVTQTEIIQYWITYYWTTYQITEYYFWLYYLGNGQFDWDAYENHVPDGPAFDGAEWLFLHGTWDEQSSNMALAFMWYQNNQCFFAVGSPDNTDPNNSGTCTINGHATTVYDMDVDKIIWYFYSFPEQAHEFYYQQGDWGPIAQMTDQRYYASEGEQFWLWMKPEGACDICDDEEFIDYTVVELPVLNAPPAPVLAPTPSMSAAPVPTASVAPIATEQPIVVAPAAPAPTSSAAPVATSQPVVIAPVSQVDGQCDTTEYADDHGDGCDWYYGMEDACGVYDTENFHADDDCCACLGECDTTPLTDSGGDTCEWYEENTYACGHYDTDSFIANVHCCACQAQAEVASDVPLSHGDGTCDSTEYADSHNDGCDWYYGMEHACGGYDTEDFHANDDCCACQAELSHGDGTCDTTQYGDSYGDGCDWYYGYPDECGDYDTEDFHANDDCCACQAEEVEEVELSHGDGTCDSTEYADSHDDGCDWYYGVEYACGNYDTDDFDANRDCCACQAEEVELSHGDGTCDSTEYADSHDDGCDWYYGMEEACGNYDTEDFDANRDCCACQVEEDEEVELSHGDGTCDSTEYADSHDDGCDWYYGMEDSCGVYDTEDFDADRDCCACQASEVEEVEEVELSHGDGTCDSTEYADSHDDGCDWYYGMEDSCGVYDTDDFDANRDCCACQEPELSHGDGNCDSTEYTDSYGDGCDYYYGAEYSCGNYDTEDFHANEDCCACQEEEMTCDTTTETDSYGDGCDYYYGAEYSCGNYDTETFHANEDCCACMA